MTRFAPAVIAVDKNPDSPRLTAGVRGNYLTDFNS
jgi:hypothetical protein